MFIGGALTALALTALAIFLLYVRGIARFEDQPFWATLKALIRQIFTGDFFS